MPKPMLVFILGGPGSGKTTIIDALKKLKTSDPYRILDKDAFYSTLKTDQSNISKLFGKVEVNADSLYRAFAEIILKDTGSPETIRLILGNFAERFITGVIDITPFIEAFDILIAQITCNSHNLHWQRVNARFNSGVQREKDIGIAENPTKFEANLKKLLAKEEAFIRSIASHISANQIKHIIIDNSSVETTPAGIIKKAQEKAQEIESFISDHHRPIFEVVKAPLDPTPSSTPIPKTPPRSQRTGSSVAESSPDSNSNDSGVFPQAVFPEEYLGDSRVMQSESPPRQCNMRDSSETAKRAEPKAPRTILGILAGYNKTLTNQKPPVAPETNKTPADQKPPIAPTGARERLSRPFGNKNSYY